MSYIKLEKLLKKFGDMTAVKEIDLEIKKGEFVTFLGPSGCGKTTTLRCISGLETPEGGNILLDGKKVYSHDEKINYPAGERGLGLVFQNYALWPHMTVEGNIAFGLRKLKVPQEEKKKRISRVINAMGLDSLEKRFPHELSGGQQQRVALARMIVNEPGILLFDEPLSNLDAKLRMKLRSELKRLHTELGATSIYVTHDQVEALALSDKIVVMKEGVIQQIGTPYEVYHDPKNLFVADFMGNPETNLIPVSISGSDFIPEADTECSIGFSGNINSSESKGITVNARPEDIDVKSSESGSFYIYTIQPMGSEVMVHLKSVNNKLDVIVKGPEENYLGYKVEEKIDITIRRGNIYNTKTEAKVETFKG